MPEHSSKHDDLIKTLDKLIEHADAPYVLVTTNALAGMLELALRSKMRNLSKTLYTELFEGYGPLSTFVAKITVAYGLSIIDHKLTVDFRAIKAIRTPLTHPHAFPPLKPPHPPKQSQH